MPLRGDVDLIALRRRHNGRERPTCMVRNSNRNWNLQGRHGAAAPVPAATKTQLCLVEGRPQELGQWPRLVAPASGCVRGSRRAAHGVARSARARARAPSNAPAPPATCHPFSPPPPLATPTHPKQQQQPLFVCSSPGERCGRIQGHGRWRDMEARCALRTARSAAPVPLRAFLRRTRSSRDSARSLWSRDQNTHSHTENRRADHIRSAFSFGVFEVRDGGSRQTGKLRRRLIAAAASASSAGRR